MVLTVNKALTITMITVASIIALLAGLWYSNVFAFTGGFPSYDYRVYAIARRDGGFDVSLLVKNKGDADLEVHGYYINGLKCHFKTFIVEGDSVSEVDLPVIVPAGESREIVVSLRGGSDCNLSFTSGQIIELLLETNAPIQYRTMITLP
ncbi:MAG: hypothetical protein QXF92_03635 [Thermosphaera sp.]